MRVKSLTVRAVNLVFVVSLTAGTSFAEVVVNIGGTQLTDTTNVNIAGNYGPNCPSGTPAITITPKVAGSNARVEVLSDSSIDNLRMMNVKIRANCPVSNFRITFGFNHTVAPTVVSPTQIRYKYFSSGNLSGAGASVKTKASYRNNPPSPPSTSFNSSGAVGSELTRTSSPFSTSGLTPNLTNITNPRGLQAEFTFTLNAANHTLEMTQYYVQDYPAAGGGDDGSAAGASLWERILLRALMTTASTSQALGCDSCDLADSSTPETEKVKVFVLNNMDNLSQDMASGRGEHLASLATLINIPVTQQTVFFSRAQEQYSALAHQGNVTPDQLLATLETARNFVQSER